MQLTKIIATVRDDYEKEKIIQLFDAGVDVIRVNFTHATPETSKNLLTEINKLNKEGRTHLSTLLDTKGPDIRTGVREDPLSVKKSQILEIIVDPTASLGESNLFCDYPGILKDVTIGQEIIIDSGALVVEVEKILEDRLVVKSRNDAMIGSKRHINLPGVKISLPTMIDKDKTDILFGIKMGVSYVAASFIRTGDNVKEIRAFLDENGGNSVKIISKIENKEALDNLEDIVKYSDGVMIARGDLGIEMPIHELPVYQKRILDICFVYGKPVIIATELMKSMVSSPFPTRAEVSDVYHSVIMRADALMLSDETAVGRYPIKAVEYMEKTIAEAEKTTHNKHKDYDIQTTEESEVLKKSLARYALMLADEIHAKMVIVFSYSGNLARYLSAFKPNVPVVSFTTEDKIHNSLGINYGVFSEKVEKFYSHMSEDQEMALSILKRKGLVVEGDQVIIVGERVVGGVHQPQMRIVMV